MTSAIVERLNDFTGISPYLAGCFILIFCLHWLIQPRLHTRSLMLTYLNEGTLVMGQALDTTTQTSKDTKNSVEVMYESREHIYADSPSLRFRNPHAFETKQFYRRFHFPRAIPWGEPVPILLPRGFLRPRSGYPRELIERKIDQIDDQRARIMAIVTLGLLVLGLLIWMSIREAIKMDRPHEGLSAVIICLVCAEILSFLIMADAFYRKKKRVYDAARPMSSSSNKEEHKQKKQRLVTQSTERPHPHPQLNIT